MGLINLPCIINRIEYDKLAYSHANWHWNKGQCVRTSGGEGDVDATVSTLHLFKTCLGTKFNQEQYFILMPLPWWRKKGFLKNQNKHIKTAYFIFTASLLLNQGTL